MTFKPAETAEAPALAASRPKNPNKPLKRRFRKWRNRLGRRLGVRFGAVAVRALERANHQTELGREHREAAEAEHGAFLVAIWHGRGVLAAPFFTVDCVTVLVSSSEDGSMATTILDKLGFEIIRGSSSRHGARALRKMVQCLESGKHLAITPDGPRGPMHSMSPGLAFLSRVTGKPILPVGLGVDKAWRLDTWDDYTIPKPNAHVVACYRPPILVPRHLTNEELDDASATIRREIREAERTAFAHLGREPDWAATVPDPPEHVS